MRLHSLDLTAIGPFATRHTIDFDQLSAGGLFLLDGPTGAGKSTILDAITFALYGPGARGGDDRLHSDFAAADVAPGVRLEFSIRGVCHRITRAPEYERPKRRGDGTTRQAAVAHLERLEAGTWVSRSSNKAEVAAMLADDVGLTREQFTQVVVLPQGEFARFLVAGDDERRALLTKLFGTQLYDRIADELERQRQVAGRDLDAAAQHVRACVAAAAEAAGLGAAERDALCALDGAQRTAALDLLADALDADVASAQAAAQAAAARLASARSEAERAEVVAQRSDRYQAAVRASDQHALSRETFHQAQQRLTCARRAEAVRALLCAVEDARATLVARQQALQAVQLEPADEPIGGTGGSADALLRQSAAAAKEAAELEHLVVREADVAGLQEQIAEATDRRDAAARALELSAQRSGALPSELATMESVLNGMHDQLARAEAAQVELEALRRRHAAAERLVQLYPEARRAAADLVTAVDVHQRAVDVHQQAIEQRLGGMAAELAGALVHGESCAVCGSRDHPSPASVKDGAVTGRAVAAAANRRAEAEGCRTELERRCEVLAIEMSACEAVADGAAPDVLADRIEANQQVIAVAPGPAEVVELRTRRDLLAEEAAHIADRHAAANARVAQAAAQLGHVTTAAADLLTSIDQARQGYLTVAARQADLVAHAQRYIDLAALVQAVTVAAEAHTAVVARANREAAAAGFTSIADAASAVLSAADQAELSAIVDDWLHEAQLLQAQLVEATARVQEFTEPGEVDVEAARAAASLARARLDDAAQDWDAAAAASDRARTRCQRFADRVAEIADAQAALSRVSLASEPVQYLSRLTRGMIGQRRVALTTYVLRHWFEHVVAAANVRLASMSSGRYELSRVDQGSSKSERSGLTLQIIDRHTGESRSTRSLSGGETFYTSLALALGLADVVTAEAGGVDLDTLFIDEGFGSLDADTLDEVMAVIDELRDRGRVVGIVSHVTELKHRIPERIEVRRLADGSSTLRVVA